MKFTFSDQDQLISVYSHEENSPAFIQEHLYQQTAGYSFIHLGSKGSCSDDYNDEDGECQHHWQEGHLATHTDVLEAALKPLNDTDRCVAIRLTFPSLSMFRYSDRGSVKATVESRITKWRSASMWSGPTADTEQQAGWTNCNRFRHTCCCLAFIWGGKTLQNAKYLQVFSETLWSACHQLWCCSWS